MPRINRQDAIPNKCIVHVRVSFNNKEYVFTRKQHYKLWQSIVKRYHKKYKGSIKLKDFTWMNTHAHFIIKINSTKDLSDFMHDMCWRFAFVFNKMNERKGHLFMGRFQASVIDTNGYLIRCQRYIYRNQLRANMVNDVEDTQFSSYHCYAWGVPCEFLTIEPFDDLYFQGCIDEQRKQFREFVKTSTPQEEEDIKLKIAKVFRYKE